MLINSILILDVQVADFLERSTSAAQINEYCISNYVRLIKKIITIIYLKSSIVKYFEKNHSFALKNSALYISEFNQRAGYSSRYRDTRFVCRSDFSSETTSRCEIRYRIYYKSLAELNIANICVIEFGYSSNKFEYEDFPKIAVISI